MRPELEPEFKSRLFDPQVEALMIREPVIQVNRYGKRKGRFTLAEEVVRLETPESALIL